MVNVISYVPSLTFYSTFPLINSLLFLLNFFILIFLVYFLFNLFILDFILLFSMLFYKVSPYSSYGGSFNFPFVSFLDFLFYSSLENFSSCSFLNLLYSSLDNLLNFLLLTNNFPSYLFLNYLFEHYLCFSFLIFLICALTI